RGLTPTTCGRPGSRWARRSARRPDVLEAPDPADPAQRSVAEPGPAHEEVHRDGAVAARVDRFAEAPRDEPGRGGVGQEPGLVTPQLQVAVVQVDPIARSRCDALDRE